jgi:hypothetical protein
LDKSLFLWFPYFQPCELPEITNSEHSWNPARDAFLMKTQRSLCIVTAWAFAGLTSIFSWSKRSLIWWRGKHGGKSQDNTDSRKNRKEIRPKPMIELLS